MLGCTAQFLLGPTHGSCVAGIVYFDHYCFRGKLSELASFYFSLFFFFFLRTTACSSDCGRSHSDCRILSAAHAGMPAFPQALAQRRAGSASRRPLQWLGFLQ